jgi:hypothetical protein
MDWQAILLGISADRLTRLSAGAGIQRATTAKKTLVRALLKHLDDALKVEALGLLSAERLRALAHQVRPNTTASRKRDLINVLIASEAEDDELELSEVDFLLPDRGRRDLPEGHNVETPIEVLPSRPTGSTVGADVSLALEVQHLLRRPGLRRAVIVLPTASSTLLGRVVTGDLDDMIESAVRHGEPSRDERAPLTFILDGTHHGLGETAAGKALVAIATSLRGIVEIRLTSKSNRLQAQLLAFEEERPEGTFLTAIVGGGALPIAAGDAVHANNIEANLRISGPIASVSPPCSLVKGWVSHLMRDARSLTDAQLRDLAANKEVVRKVAYKRNFDTAHELALKHIAEQICRRGRQSCPLFDPTSLEPPPRHQQIGICLAARPYQRGILLLDDAGLGKTVQAGLILSRELRRRRVLAASDTMDRRRALVVAPTSLHHHWREELTAKLGLEVCIFDPAVVTDQAQPAQVLICGPVNLRRSWEDLQGIDILVIDEAMLFGDETMAVLREVRRSVELCLVLSSVPVFDDPTDLLSLADLASPEDGFGELGDLLADEIAVAQVGEEMRGMCARTRMSDIPESKALRRRSGADRTYDLDETEVDAYAELRCMRTDFLARGDHDYSGAFAALERAFLSSAQAFAAAVSCILEDETTSHDAALFELEEADTTYGFLRQSAYFKRRIRAVRDRLGRRLRPSAPLAAKEAALLACLAECKREPVVIITRYRATAARLVMALERAKITGEVEHIDEASALRERLGIVTRFRARCEERKKADGPAGVLVCTDASVEELSLQKAAHVLVNYDMPWNPQAIERRIGRLARWGQKEPVRFFNLVATHPDKPMWTMDARIAYACRELFSMSEGAASQALYEVEPKVLVSRLTEDDAPELSLIEDPDPDVIAEVDDWFGDVSVLVSDSELETATAEDVRMREQLADLWVRVSHRQGTLAGARGHLFGRLQQALLQGMVGVLCAPDRSIDDCDDWHVVVGLRLLVESATLDAGEPWGDAPDDVWLVEDEVVHLWAVSPEGDLMDWAEFLLGEGLAEVRAKDAERVVDREVLDYLLAEKRSLESRQLDAVPLSAWLTGAPAPLKKRLEVVAAHAAAMVEVRHAEIEAGWAEAKDARLVRLDARRPLVADNPAAKKATEAALKRAHSEDVTIRHEVLGTQLFIVTH